MCRAKQRRRLLHAIICHCKIIKILCHRFIWSFHIISTIQTGHLHFWSSWATVCHRTGPVCGRPLHLQVDVTWLPLRRKGLCVRLRGPSRNTKGTPFPVNQVSTSSKQLGCNPDLLQRERDSVVTVVTDFDGRTKLSQPLAACIGFMIFMQHSMHFLADVAFHGAGCQKAPQIPSERAKRLWAKKHFSLELADRNPEQLYKFTMKSPIE